MNVFMLVLHNENTLYYICYMLRGNYYTVYFSKDEFTFM